MKALGIIRKIDDLGRVVIPKEVRKAKGWGKDQPMEMFVDGDELVLRAYGADREKQEVINTLERVQGFMEGGPSPQLEDELKVVIEKIKSQ